MINCVKNKKASILPVTVIAMFIVMIVGYACIKMFLVQNIIATTDQIKIRTRYAAEGLAEKEKSAIYDLIKKQFKEDPNVTIKSDTSLSGTGINNLNKNGQNFSIAFSSKLVANGTDLASSPFVAGEKMYPSISNASPSNPLSTMDPKDWLSDGGVKFYKIKGVTNVDVGTLKYNDYMEINNTVYPYSESDNKDPRNIENKRIGDGYGNNLGTEYVSFFAGVYDYAFSTACDIVTNVVESKCIYRVKLTGSVKNTIDANLTTAKNIAKLKNPPSLNYNGKYLLLSAWHEKYCVKNIRQGYVLTATAESPRIPATGPVIRIPKMTSTVKIYFDVFMTELYKKRISYSPMDSNGSGNGVWTVGQGNAGTWNNTAFTMFSNPTVYTRYLFVPDRSKKINDIKFHIQKWEVVS